MNANELADELEKFELFNGDVFFGTCAVMLRQQQDEIEALKNKKEHWENQYIIENKKWKFAEKSFSDLLMRTVNNASQQVKELTTKKIKEILTDMYGDDWTEEDITFAIAILKKAQEK